MGQRRVPTRGHRGAGPGSGSCVFTPGGTVLALRREYREAVDPARAPGPVRTWSRDELAAALAVGTFLTWGARG